MKPEAGPRKRGGRDEEGTAGFVRYETTRVHSERAAPRNPGGSQTGMESLVLPDGRVDSICEGTTYASDSTYYFYRARGRTRRSSGPLSTQGSR